MIDRIRFELAKNCYCSRQTFTKDSAFSTALMTSFDFHGNGHKTWIVYFSRKFKNFEEALKFVYIAGFGI